jgi:hypothetical protein
MCVCVFYNYAHHTCSMHTNLSRALPFEPKRHHAPSFVSPTICILVTIAMITHLSMLPFQHPFVIPNQTTIFLIACLCRSHCSNHYCLPCTITFAPRASVKSHLNTMHREELPPLSTTLRSNSDSLPRGADLSPQWGVAPLWEEVHPVVRKHLDSCLEEPTRCTPPLAPLLARFDIPRWALPLPVHSHFLWTLPLPFEHRPFLHALSLLSHPSLCALPLPRSFALVPLPTSSHPMATRQRNHCASIPHCHFLHCFKLKVPHVDC